MSQVTISAKVGRDLVSKIEDTGYSISEVLQIGVKVFLELPYEDQKDLIWEHYTQKNLQRGLSRNRNIKLNRGVAV